MDTDNNNNKITLDDDHFLITAKNWTLAIAESIDAIRLVPRIIVGAYGYLMINLYLWFTHIPTVMQEKCDPTLMQILLDHGKSLEMAKDLACYVVDVVGGPTTAQTTFVTIIIGLATPLFAFYVTTGRKWGSNS